MAVASGAARTVKIDPAPPMEFFKEAVDGAIARQKVSSSAETVCYLTQLLDRFVRPGALYNEAGVASDQPLAVLLCRALKSEGRQRFLRLKLTGDVALFVSGFFASSRELVSCDYYGRLGGQAYGTLSQEHRFLNELFAELAEKFARFADVLSEVSAQCSLTDDRDLLRLYERWLKTGSERSARLLREQGVSVVPASDAVH